MCLENHQVEKQRTPALISTPLTRLTFKNKYYITNTARIKICIITFPLFIGFIGIFP